MRIRFLLAAALAGAPLATPAQTPDALYVRGLAATCASCHGTDGHTAAGSAVPALAGMPREYMVQQLRAFRDGTRPATVMHQIASGFSESQMRSMAAYFAAQAK